MVRRVVSARDQVEMLSPWREAAQDPAPPVIHDLMPGAFSDGNGRWDYRHQETSGGSYVRHDYGIHPTASPASHTFTDEWGKSHTVHYDPNLTGGQVPKPGRFGHEWDDPQALRNEITDLAPLSGMLWRGVSQEEYDLAKKRGYFESRGDYNVGGDSQRGYTFFSTDPSQAGNYATWFAPQDFKPTFTHPGHVIGIPDRPELPRGAMPEKPDPRSTEVGVPGRVPFSAVTHHYVGRPSTIKPGRQGVSESWSGWERSGGSQPSSDIVWEDHSSGNRLAALQHRPRRPGETPVDYRDLWERPAGLGADFDPFDDLDPYEEGRYARRTAGPRRRFNQEWQVIGGDYVPLDVISHYMQRKETGFADEKSRYNNDTPLSQQIDQGGYEKPVELITDGKSGSVYDGHHRIDVARQLGHTHVPVQVTWRVPDPVWGADGAYGNKIEPWLKKWLTDMRGGRETVGRRVAADDDYRGRHRGPDPEYGAPLHDVESMFPDYHQHPEYYRTYQPYDHQSESKILKYRGRPDARVDIYRALPMSAGARTRNGVLFPLNRGDWVTTSYDYAKEHGESNLHHSPWTILHTKAPASSLFTEGNSIHEWAYQGDNQLAGEHPTARSQRYRRKKMGQP